MNPDKVKEKGKARVPNVEGSFSVISNPILEQVYTSVLHIHFAEFLEIYIQDGITFGPYQSQRFRNF